MTRRTRYFLLGSAGVLIVGLCTGLVAYYGGFPSVAFLNPSPEELRYVPADATVVAYANVRAVMASELRQRLRGLEPERAEKREFEERTGIDIEQDIDHVVACALADGERADRDRGGLVLLRGRFDTARLETLARQHGGEVIDYKGRRLVLVPEKGERRRAPAIVFLEPGLIGLGDEGTVRRAVDLRDGREAVTANAELMRLIHEVEGGHDAWAVGRFDRLASAARVPQEVREKIPAVHWFAAGGRVDGGVSGTLRAETRDETAAKDLRDVVRGFVALAKLQSSAKPELQAMLQSIEIEGTGNTVVLSFNVPAQVFDIFTPSRRRERREQ